MVPSETRSRQAEAALQFHLLLRHFALGGPGSISPDTAAAGNAALRCTMHSARHSKQLHPWLRGARSTGITTQGAPHWGTRHANPFVAFASSKWLTCTIQICRAFVTKGILNCWISTSLLGWTRFGGSSPVFGVMGQNDLWRHFCGSCRGGRGPGVPGFLPLEGRSLWQYTLPAADLAIKQITKHCPWHKQTPLLYIQSSAQTELSRTLQNKFESNINVHPREKDEGKTHASNSFSSWSKS